MRKILEKLFPFSEPSTFEQMRALFPAENTLQRKPEWEQPEMKKFELETA